MNAEPVEYRPSLAKTLGMFLFFAIAAVGGAWFAFRPASSARDRLIGLAAAGLFGPMALVVLYATLRFRAYLRLDARGIRMVDRFGRPRLDVAWDSVANAYEADVGRNSVVVLVASDLPSNLGDGLSAPQSLTGPNDESLGYGYVVDPAIVDLRAPDLIAQVQRRLEGRLADWDPREATRETKP